MKPETWHTFIVAFVIVVAIILLKGARYATPDGVLNIATAAQTPPSAWGNLPAYVSYNISPWGPVMQPFIDTSSGVNLGMGASSDDAGIYGPYYSN